MAEKEQKKKTAKKPVAAEKKPAAKKIAAKKTEKYEEEIELPSPKKTVKAKKVSTIEAKPVKKAPVAAKIKKVKDLTEHTMSTTTEEADIEASKFYQPEEEEKSATAEEIKSAPAPQRPEDFMQDKYGDNKVVLMARDPYWCYVYWDLSPEYMGQKAAGINESYELVLRVHDVTDLKFDGANSHKYVDIKVHGEAGNWYLNVWAAGRTYVVDIGYKTASGAFILLARSNYTGTPSDKVSHVTDEEWMVIDEDFEEIFRLSGGGRLRSGSSEGFRSVLESNLNMGSETISSFSSSSLGGEQARGFFLWADTEVILYGGTEKNALLRVKGEKVDLKEDGTFSLRFHLPDGLIDLPVDATSADGKENISIKISVERKTK